MQVDVPEGSRVSLKRDRLALIVENLVSNSIKYQDPSRPDSFLRIKTQEANNELILSVEDNGLGVPLDQRHKLFGMFQRLHGRVSFGSGIGLYMMKKSAQVLGGDIFFEDPGQGAKFVLKVPLDVSAHE